MSEKQPAMQGDKCPRCKEYGDAVDGDFGEFNGSRTFKCVNSKCLCKWETAYIVQAITQIIDE